MEIRVQERTSELDGTNRDLTDFNYIATHDLQEPLRLILTLGDLLVSEYQEHLDMVPNLRERQRLRIR